MIGMQMGEEDGLDVFRLDAQCPQIVGQLAQRGTHAVAGTGVDQYRADLVLDEQAAHAELNAISLVGHDASLPERLGHDAGREVNHESEDGK